MEEEAVKRSLPPRSRRHLSHLRFSEHFHPPLPPPPLRPTLLRLPPLPRRRRHGVQEAEVKRTASHEMGQGAAAELRSEPDPELLPVSALNSPLPLSVTLPLPPLHLRRPSRRNLPPQQQSAYSLTCSTPRVAKTTATTATTATTITTSVNTHLTTTTMVAGEEVMVVVLGEVVEPRMFDKSRYILSFP